MAKRIAQVLITKQMEIDNDFCGEDSDCANCSCCIGTDDCIFNYEMEEQED